MQRVQFFGVIAMLLYFVTGCVSFFSQGQRVIDLQNGICQDIKTGMMWTTTRSQIVHNFNDALSYSETLKVGGYSDWRIPTASELHDIFYLYDLRRQGFNCVMEMEGNYWSATPNGDGEAGAWESLDNCGRERRYYHKQFGHVLAVRKQPAISARVEQESKH